MATDAERTASSGSPKCRLLDLPLELRLQIYTYILHSTAANVTFTALPIDGDICDVVKRLNHGDREPWYGLHLHHVPVVEPYYHASLLSLTHRAQIDPASAIRSEERGICDYLPRPGILQANRQIRAEILDNWSAEQRRSFNHFSLFLEYPCGLHVFNDIGSHLLPGARTVQLAGEHHNPTFSAKKAAKVEEPDQEPGFLLPPEEAALHLSKIVSSLCGQQPHGDQLSMRIYFPGPDSYSAVWGDECSPIVVALKNIYAGNIQVVIWRGNEGTGVAMSVKPNNKGQRSVSTIWRKLEPDGYGGKLFVLDPRWPKIVWFDDDVDNALRVTDNET